MTNYNNISGEYPVRGWIFKQVPYIELYDPDFRGGNTFSFAGVSARNERVSNAAGQNPAAMAAFQTGASIEQLLKLYNQSGSQMPFLQWIQQDEVKNQIKTLVAQGADIANGNYGKDMGTVVPAPDDIKNETETKIMGFSPIGFGIFSVLTLVGVGVLAYNFPKIINAFKSTTPQVSGV